MYKIDSTVHEVNFLKYFIYLLIIKLFFEFQINLFLFIKEHAKNTERHNNSVAYMINFENVMFKDCCPIIV